MAFAAYRDLADYRIPNWIPVALGCAFLAAAIGAGWPISDILIHLGVGLGVLVAAATLFFLGLFGGGDAKLLAAGTLWIGWEGLTAYLLLVAIIGGGLALLVLLARKIGLPARWKARTWAARLLAPEGKIPYGVAIAVASLLLFGEVMSSLSGTG